MLKMVINEPHTNVRTAELMLDLVLSNVPIKNQVGDDFRVTDTNASDMLACKTPVHRKIRQAASTRKVIDAAEEYVVDALVDEISKDEIDGFVHRLVLLIENDASIPKAKRDGLLAKASADSPVPFLADILLYVLKKPNKSDASEKAAPSSTEYENLLQDVADASRRLQSAPRPTAVPVPALVDEETEVRYVSALLDAYADAEKLPCLPLEQLAGYPRYKDNFNRQRKDFYAAESVRRSARDAFGKDNDAFNSLRSETYDGIIDVHSLDYGNGYERLNHVLAHATTLVFPNCVIQKANWLGKSEQKGICHMLVNDGEVDGWVDEYE